MENNSNEIKRGSCEFNKEIDKLSTVIKKLRFAKTNDKLQARSSSYLPSINNIPKMFIPRLTVNKYFE